MSKRCARCEKTVYPIEELKCLDKVWHKGCFKCQECGMTLSMKTYKGFNKLPYCEAHIPKAKATAVAETPEMKRLAENTKIQSNVQYHADFEKNKAKFTQVADDPETRRIKQNTKIISNVSYHGDMEKKAIMELRRSDPIGEKEEQEPNDHPRDHQAYQQPHQQPQLPPQPQQQPQQQQHVKVQQSIPSPASSQQYRGTMTGPAQNLPYNTPAGHNVPPNAATQQYYQSSQPQPNQAYHQYPQSTHPYYQNSQTNSHAAPHNPGYNSHHHTPHPQQSHHYPKMHSSQVAPATQNVYQDANHNSPYSARTSQTLIYSSQTGPVQQPTSSRRVGSIADYDPMNEHYGSLAPTRAGHPHAGNYRQEPGYAVRNTALYGDTPRHSNTQPVQQKITAPPTQLGRCYRALYDYEAADTDEVSFKDGDLIINCTSIDEGWMTGTVQRSNRTGMLPANYVERVS